MLGMLASKASCCLDVWCNKVMSGKVMPGSVHVLAGADQLPVCGVGAGVGCLGCGGCHVRPRETCGVVYAAAAAGDVAAAPRVIC